MIRRSHSSLLPLALIGFSAAVMPVFAQGQAAQTAAAGANDHTVFKANARTVVIDVVVTGKNGQPVEGLHRADFLATEDKHPQTISFFEEHSVPRSEPAALPALPPNVFTNVPRITPTDSVTVLLLDSLNTPIQDQSFVRSQMMKYLQAPLPGRRMAIFALGNRLRFVQGFTDDPSILASVVNDPKSGAGPQPSTLLRSSGESSAEDQMLANISDHGGGAGALRDFLGQQVSFQTDQRVLFTLEAFQELANYLAGIPGRKNVVWFSSAFPLVIFANPNMSNPSEQQRDYSAKVQETDDLLAAADVAIYPIAAEGLATNGFNEASTQVAGVHSAYDMQQQQSKTMLDESIQRNADHETMEEIARQTGGEAIYNSNGLSDALAEVADHGSRFYTIAYTPINLAADGRYRKIQVKLAPTVAGDGYKLAYRRGYYATDAKLVQAMASKPGGDPLHPSMGPGMPDATQIPVALRIQRGMVVANPVFAPALTGTTKNASSKVGAKLKEPVTRYSVDFVIAARGLQLDASANGGYHGKVELALVVYDRDGAALNWLIQQHELEMDAARYAQVQENGVKLRMEIDVPKDGSFVRGGVYDLASHQAGTLEVRFKSVVDSAQSASSKSP